MALNTGWTEKESQILKKLWEEGQSASKCGAILKRSRSAIIGKVHRMGIKSHGPNIIRSPRKKTPKPKVATGLKDKVYYIPTFPTKPINKKHFEAGSHTPVPLDYLTTLTCRWPLEDENGKHLGYCGCNKTGTEYCDYHAAIAYPALRELKKQKQEGVA
ncbi:MAG: hypothetical protein DHS20C07_18970 [Methyloligella sp.]|nr:MAG: hypothetical protein DHS20C07_18970 [Methyloligella sp.]